MDARAASWRSTPSVSVRSRPRTVVPMKRSNPRIEATARPHPASRPCGQNVECVEHTADDRACEEHDRSPDYCEPFPNTELEHGSKVSSTLVYETSVLITMTSTLVMRALEPLPHGLPLACSAGGKSSSSTPVLRCCHRVFAHTVPR